MSRNTPFINTFVHTKKTPFMQRVADLVRTGHTQYVIGQVALKKAGYLAGKFSGTLSINEDKVQAFRARKKGLPTARLLFLEAADPDLLHWILLMQSGEQPDVSGQNWRDALEDRIAITGYELVRKTRPGAQGPAWTWRYTQASQNRLHDEIVAAIRHKDDAQLRQLIDSIRRSPGFAAVRDQVKELKNLIGKEWKRSRRSSEPLPVLPRHGYVRRIEDVGMRLNELISLRHKAGRGLKTSQSTGSVLSQGNW
jgi:hypothetical protein